MAKIENIKVYPTVTPSADDLLIATDVSDNNKTVTFTVGSIGGGAGILQGLQSVLDVNNVATGKDILLTGNINAFGGYMNADQYHINGSPGLAGQVLTSGGPSGSATWSTPSGGSSCCNIQNTLAVGDTTQLSLIMNGAGEQLSISGGTNFNVGSGSDINMTGGSDMYLGAGSSLNFNATATLQDGTGSEGLAGQILTVNAAGTGLEWTTGLPGGSTPSWQQTLQVGNTANNISVNLTTAPLNLDATSPINSAGVNNFTGNTTFTYQGSAVPAIIMEGAIQDSLGNTGGPKQVLSPSLTDPGKLEWVNQSGSNNLQSTLDNGNSAIQDIILQGSIDLTYGPGNGELILGGNVQINANSSTGTVGQFLTATATGVEWTTFTPGNPNLQTVLDAGNTADQNITLTGVGNNITSDIMSPNSINVTNGTGGTNQILQSNNGVLSWVANTATGMNNWLFEGDTGAQQVITDGALVQFLGDNTAISTQSTSLDVLNISHDLFGTAGTYAFPSSITTNTTGHITSITTGTAPTSYTLGSQPSGPSNVELDLTDSLGGVSTVTLVAGANVTLADNGSNQITISAASASGMTNFFIVSDSGTGSKQSVTDGIDYLFEGGTYLTTFQTGGTPNTLTINHDATTRTDTTSSSSPAFGGTFTVIDTMTSNATGHVTDVNTKTITLPASSGVTSISVSDGLYSAPNPIINTGNIQVDYLTTDNVVLSAAAWAGMAIDDLDTMLINDATTDTVKYISIADLKVVFAVGTVTTFSAQINGNALTESVTNPTTTPDLVLAWAGSASQYVNGAGDLINISTLANTTYDLSSVQNGADADIKLIGSDATTDIVKIEAGNNITITDTGSNIKIDASASSGLTSFTLDGNTGSQQTIDNTNPNMTVLGGTNLNSVMSATNTVTVDHNNQSRTDTPTTLTPSAGSVIPIVTAVTSSATGHVTGTDVKTITWPLSVTSVGLSYVTTGGSSVAGSSAFTVSSSPITGSGTISLTSTGTGAQYIDGEGKLKDFPTIPTVPAYTLSTLQNGATVEIDLNADGTSVSQIDLVGGTNINVTKSLTNTITIDMAGTIGTVTNVSSSHAGTAFAVTVTNPTTTPDIDITMAGNASQYINGAGDLVNISTLPNTTYDLTVPTATTDIRLAGSDGTNDDVTITGGANVTVTRVSATELSIAAAAGTGLSSFTLDGDSGAQQTVDAANPDMNILGGLVISSVASGTNNITLNHDNVTRTNTFAGTVAPGSGGTIDVITSFTSTSQGHIDEVVTTTLELPAVGGTVTSVGLAAPSAFTVTNSPVTTSGTLTLAGAGTTAQYIDGTGALQTFPPIDNTTYTYGSAQQGSNVELDLTSSAGLVDIVTLVAGTGITLTDSGTSQVTIAGTLGTVTSVGAAYSNAGGTGSAGAAAFTVGVTNPTSTPIITLTGDGSSAQYIDGTGSLVTFPTINNTTYDLTTAPTGTAIRLTGTDGTNDDVTLTGGTNVTITRTSASELTIDASAGTGLSSFQFVGNQAGSTTETVDTTNNLIEFNAGAVMAVQSSSTNKLTIAHAGVPSNQNTLPAVSPSPGTSVSLVTGVTVSPYGHVTDVDTTPVNWPSASGQVDSVGYTYTTPGPQTAVAGDPAFVASVGGTAINPILDLEAQGKGAAQFIDGSGILQDFPAIPTQWSGWIADADVNTSPAWTINNATTLKFVGEVTTGGAGIVTSTIPNTELQIGLINNGGTPSATTFYNGAGQWATPTGNIYTIGGGNINTGNTNTFIKLEENGFPTSSSKITGTGGTTVSYDYNLNTFTIDSSTGSATNFKVQGSTGSTVTITQNDTLSLLAGTGISTVSASGTDSVTIANTGVTSLVAGSGISLSGSTGAVTVTATASKQSGIFLTENYNFCGAAWSERYTNAPSSWTGITARAPRFWNARPDADCVNDTSFLADDYSWWTSTLQYPSNLQLVTGQEGGINSPIWACPHVTGTWTADVQAFSITFSANIIGNTYGNLGFIDVLLAKGKPCGDSTGINTEYEIMGNCTVPYNPAAPGNANGNQRVAYCCASDISKWTTTTVKAGEALYIFLLFRTSGGSMATLATTSPGSNVLRFTGQARVHLA